MSISPTLQEALNEAFLAVDMANLQAQIESKRLFNDKETDDVARKLNSIMTLMEKLP
jgi:hypothetical protein